MKIDLEIKIPEKFNMMQLHKLFVLYNTLILICKYPHRSIVHKGIITENSYFKAIRRPCYLNLFEFDDEKAQTLPQFILNTSRYFRITGISLTINDPCVLLAELDRIYLKYKSTNFNECYGFISSEMKIMNSAHRFLVKNLRYISYEEMRQRFDKSEPFDTFDFLHHK